MTKSTKIFLSILIIAALGAVAFTLYQNNTVPQDATDNGATDAPAAEEEDVQPDNTSDVSDLIRLDEPQENAVITSPLTVRGEARGTWYFEATFPLVLVNWDGLIIAQGYAQAQDEWMTEDFVPFVGTLEFERPFPDGAQDFMKRGALILQKDNPSGLPEHDAALEVWIRFGE
ncbi:MAG: Gmad2 immunoglobulin-like domain-containing protein [bacterium]|nr:Gmad2 immunoglobulin-like domain-containing protein [bacterium]